MLCPEHERVTEQADRSASAGEPPRIRRAIERADGGYEYSSEHNYGWRDGDAYYLYGDGVWDTSGTELPDDAELLDAAREVHRRAMIDAASRRGRERTVGEMLSDGNEPLVVADSASGPPSFGQDV